MKKALIAVLLCAVLAASVSANVIDLTPENFDEVVEAHKFTFVEFFAPWYVHSRCYLLALHVTLDLKCHRRLREARSLN